MNIDYPANEIMQYQMLDTDILDAVVHYGTKRHSGRYPWGSGMSPYQHEPWFLDRYHELRSSGLTEEEIATALGYSSVDDYKAGTSATILQKYYNYKNGPKKMTEKEIANALGYPSTTQLRVAIGVAGDEVRSYEVAWATKLRQDGKTLQEITDIMGFNNDSSVRALLNEDRAARMEQSKKVADDLKTLIDEKGMLDVSKGVERELNISEAKLKESLAILQNEGYPIYKRRVEQITNPGQFTTFTILCPKGYQQKDVYPEDNGGSITDIHSVKDYLSYDYDGVKKKAFRYPESMDSSRLAIRYAEDGGKDKDGVIEIRRGVKDLSLGESNYAQVRILVDGNRYLKGMAVYSDDLPDGVDVLFNTNKEKSVPKMEVLKKTKKDKDGNPSENPFGSAIKAFDAGGQSEYLGDDGKMHLSLINKTREEGEWNEWSKKLPSQFLSKQPEKLVKNQLNLSVVQKKEELAEIESITNPTVKKYFLNSFAEDCDKTAVHLEAAALPRQRYQVILPVPDMKDGEVYAPNFNNGEQVALIRFPHEGTFQIPICTVNNKQATAKKMFGNSKDVAGINSNTAAKMSGADFDGDTVMVIPLSNKVNIKSTPTLKGLEGFDPSMSYPYSSEQIRLGETRLKYDELRDKAKTKAKQEGTSVDDNELLKQMNEWAVINNYKKFDSVADLKATYKQGKQIKLMRNTQNEMGRISNLITDMTLQGATPDKLARAVRHSMTVIDAEKHNLDYKRSEYENDIESLRQEFQKHADGSKAGGAATIISRAKSQDSKLKTQGTPRINPDTGELIYKTADDAIYVDYRTGEVKTKTQKTTKMANTNDAFTLVSDANNPIEIAYANYANQMKALANQARKEIVSTGNLQYSKEAAQTYKKEVDSLLADLNLVKLNAPRERLAQLIATSKVDAMTKDNPMTKEEIRKAKQQQITKARLITGAERHPMAIDDREWEAIQAGAIHENVLRQILLATDADDLRERATPRKERDVLTPAQQDSMRAMLKSGYTQAEVAEKYGISVSTVIKYLGGDS